MIIIGIGHKAQNGKDTAGEAIKAYHDNQATLLRQHGLTGGLKTVIVKFAGALYEEVNEALKNGIWDNRTVYGEPFLLNTSGKTIVGEHYVMPTNATGRAVWKLPDWVQPDPNPEITALAPYGKHSKLLIWWGTEYRRAQDPDYWVKKALDSIPVGTNLAIFTDVRFKNEAEAIKAKGGHLIEVVRLNQDGSRFYSDDRPRDHASETELDGYNWDHFIKTKYAAETAEQAMTIVEFIRTLETK